MNKVCIGAICVASFGIVTLFLPWINLDFLIVNITYNVFNVFEMGVMNDPMPLGIVALLLFVVVIIASGLFNRNSKLKFVSLAASVINVILGVVIAMRIDDALFPMFILDFASVGLALYFVACVALLVLSFLMKKKASSENPQ